jgi:hypothetical protein
MLEFRGRGPAPRKLEGTLMVKIFAAILPWSMYLVLVSAQAIALEPRNAGWTPDAMLAVKQVGGVQVSPDGRRVACVVRRAVMEAEKSEFVAQIHVADADGGGSYPLTGADSSSDAPRWSPDGKQIAFLAKRTGKTQVWVISWGAARPGK